MRSVKRFVEVDLQVGLSDNRYGVGVAVTHAMFEHPRKPDTPRPPEVPDIVDEQPPDISPAPPPDIPPEPVPDRPGPHRDVPGPR
jgi:hypothetical protein